jgi:hypothetical protein
MKKLILLISLFFITVELYAQTRLHYGGANKKLMEAVNKANQILTDSIFYQQITLINHFDNSEYSGSKIAQEIHKLNRTVEVGTYWNFLSKATGKTVSKIKINTAKLNRPFAEIVNTLIHESIHAVDFLTNEEWDYTHDGNSADGQDKTAPWIIGDIAEKIVN